jgi:type I restriction enzyme M protein
LIQAIVDVMVPRKGERICDPACGTGGFLLAAYDYVANHNQLDRDEWLHLRQEALHGWEIVDATARLCVMNLYLHGIGHQSERSPIHVDDALANKPGEPYDVVLTNPPFGKKSSVTYITEEGEVKREAQTVVRDDFWTSTSNKQLNFVQHVHKLLKIHGRAAVVVPDNVLFEGGAGETVRRKLLQESDLHTILRLPTGIFYAQGVKANVLFFDRKPGRERPWTEQVWFYDYRTNVHHTLKQNPLARADLDEFVKCFHPANRHERVATYQTSEVGEARFAETSEVLDANGRWRAYSIDDILARDKVNLDIFWLRDESLADADGLPEPDVIAAEIVEDLEAALEQFRLIMEDLGETMVYDEIDL